MTCSPRELPVGSPLLHRSETSREDLLPIMPVRFAINGLGRIGRTLVRVAASRPELDLVAVNDLVPRKVSAHLLRRDSLHYLHHLPRVPRHF